MRQVRSPGQGASEHSVMHAPSSQVREAPSASGGQATPKHGSATQNSSTQRRPAGHGNSPEVHGGAHVPWSQTPPAHTSIFVHSVPSLQGVLSATTGLELKKSGRAPFDWVHEFSESDGKGSPTWSNDPGTLKEPFKGRYEKFKAELVRCKLTVVEKATMRPRERAHLMHFAWRVAKGELTPEAANAASHAGFMGVGRPPVAPIAIDWKHQTTAASVAAAQAMVDGYRMAVMAVLKSNHFVGHAVDVKIDWPAETTVKVKDASGKDVDCKSPSNAVKGDDGAGALCKALWAVGATYGVKKLDWDKPHWSIDGD